MLETDIVIEGVKTLMDAIKSHPEIGKSGVVFRGQSDFLYELLPSLYRNQKWVENEKSMISEVMAQHPEEFRNDVYMLDILVRLQHFGLPTRLLDVTRNALVALFFAANDESKHHTDGAFFAISSSPKYKINYFDGRECSILANLANISSRDKDVLIEHFYENRRSKYKGEDVNDFNSLRMVEKLRKLVTAEDSSFETTITPFDTGRFLYVSPKKDNPRINAQSGAFIIFGAPINFRDGKPRFTSFFNVSKFIVKSSTKATILDELRTLGISEHTIYPEIDKTTSFVKRKFLS